MCACIYFYIFTHGFDYIGFTTEKYAKSGGYSAGFNANSVGISLTPELHLFRRNLSGKQFRRTKSGGI